MTCQIRPWKTEDAQDLAAALNNPKVQANLRDGLPFPYTAEDAKEYIASMLAADPTAVFVFAIEACGKVIGSIGVFRKENIHFRTAEAGYYIAEEYWGQGLGSQALAQTCEFVFGNTDIIRIFAEPFAYNAASCRILEKCGFVCEGVMRSNAVKDGKVLDMKLYALVKPF